MKTEQTYHVARYGMYYPDPPRLTLEQAKKEIAAEALASLKRAKQRTKDARLYHYGHDRRIVLGQDPSCPLWDAFSIQPNA